MTGQPYAYVVADPLNAAGLAEGAGAGVAAAGAGLAAVAASPGIVAAGLATVALAPAGYLVYDGLSQGDYFGEPVLPPGGLPTPPPFPNAGLGCQSGLITCPDAGSQTLGLTPTLPGYGAGYRPPTLGGYQSVQPSGYAFDQPAAPSDLVPLTLYAGGRPTATVTNPKLINIINALYRPHPSNVVIIGDGGAADAIRQEMKTGTAVGGKFHTTKGQELSTALQGVIATPGLDPEDKAVAQSLLTDLTEALAGR